jgi:hypothetical protein
MDVLGRSSPRADLRVGDADRQAVVAELQRHFVEGRLTSDELGERVEKALNARVFGDFAPLLADLPALAVDATPARRSEWRHYVVAQPLGAILILIGILAMLWMFVAPNIHMGFFPFWPVLIWGFFFIGRPSRGRRF